MSNRQYAACKNQTAEINGYLNKIVVSGEDVYQVIFLTIKMNMPFKSK